ncbi:MAG: FAD-dependent oxidoreductase [Mesosutterella sp.]|nr:FAD-dependent oxidoreductase [Mesosutterella sp.]
MKNRPTFDVIVIGSGLAGLCAALSASENGLRVLLVERALELGGTTRLSNGVFNCYDPKRQNRVQVEDSPEKHLQDMLRVGRGRNQRRLAETVCYEGYPTLLWLANKGFEFEANVKQVPGAPYPRCHSPKLGGGSAYIAFLSKLLKKSNLVELRKGFSVESLLMSRDGKRVEGIEGIEKAGRVRLWVKCGVVLAHGGYQANAKLLSRYAPFLDGVKSLGAAECSGELMLTAQDAGAQVVNAGYYVWETKIAGEGTVLHHPERFILVNDRGERFCREDLNFDALGERILQLPGKRAWCISPALSSVDQVPFSKRSLKVTLAQYSREAAFGKDPLFQKAFCFTKPLSGKIGIANVQTYLRTTLGGLQINEKSQVLNRHGKPIARLYAAGDAVGGILGCWATVGDTIAAAAVFGKIAGQSLFQQSRGFG